MDGEVDWGRSWLTDEGFVTVTVHSADCPGCACQMLPGDHPAEQLLRDFFHLRAYRRTAWLRYAVVWLAGVAAGILLAASLI